MYQIDLSFLSGNSDDTDVQVVQSKQNQTYQNIIIDNVGSTPANGDGKSETSEKDSQDLRQIFEVESGGILGTHFCSISDLANEELHVGDEIIIRQEDVLEISKVIEIGEIVKYKRNCLGLTDDEMPSFVRMVNEYDFEKINRNKRDKERAKPIFLSLVKKLKLEMKLVDIHFQFDRKKLYFFYTSDGRVDFRQLAKDLASEFKTRIELRQIGVRDEAKQIGGMGTCGREYCCSSFMCNCKRISTQFASEQNLNVSFSKMSGPCCKLKCCLSFELDQ